MIFRICQCSDLSCVLVSIRSNEYERGTYPSLWNNIVGITLAETCTLKKVHDIGLTSTLLVKTVFILLETDCSTEDDFVSPSWETIVRVVEDDLDWRQEQMSWKGIKN